jgi:hypothetical protein
MLSRAEIEPVAQRRAADAADHRVDRLKMEVALVHQALYSSVLVQNRLKAV